MKGKTSGELIIKGFWMGVGLIIPLALAISIFNYVQHKFIYGDYTDVYDSFTSGIDKSAIELSAYKEKMQGKQLLILGSFKNTHSEEINSLELEAELFDENDKFVYECSESIYHPIASGQVENYQIKCGCNENGLPNYKSLKVSVVKVGAF